MHNVMIVIYVSLSPSLTRTHACMHTTHKNTSFQHFCPSLSRKQKKFCKKNNAHPIKVKFKSHLYDLNPYGFFIKHLVGKINHFTTHKKQNQTTPQSKQRRIWKPNSNKIRHQNTKQNKDRHNHLANTNPHIALG